MRIAFDSQIFVQQSYGGISRYFTRLAENLGYMEQQVGVFAPLYCNSYLSSLPEELVHGRYIHHFPPKTAKLFVAYNKFRSRRSMARWQPDLVHETYYSKSRIAPTECPVVITVLDMIHDLFPKDFLDHSKTVAVKQLAVDRADHVICISQNTKKDLMRLYGIPEGKISVVYLGFDQFSASSNKSRVVTPSGKPFILYVGNRGGYKNFLGLLNAVSSSEKLESEFNIVAFGGGQFTSSELKEISNLGFAENQVMQKGGSDDLLGVLYSSASAFVYPSLYEGFGIPPLEAMAHQCPVISSNTSSMPEVVGNAAELFDPESKEEMRSAIEHVVFSSERTRLLVSHGAERIKQFSWEKCSNETLNVYNKVL